ncbi:MAG: cell wall hydrolase [Firmicutes bacterium]|nr:cell wall hydrolase [Bacillota bacterium]
MLKRKMKMKEELKKKIVATGGILLIPLTLALYPLSVMTAAGRGQSDRQAGVNADPVQENRPAEIAPRAGGVEVARGAAVNRSDVLLLARVIEGEAAGEPYAGKVAVGAVIINRTKSPDFPKSIPGVIYDDGAFESVSNGQYQLPPTEESVRAATEAASGADPTGGALYFWNPARSMSRWVDTRPVITQIGDHVFAR